MIKDLAEAIYYTTITDSMEKASDKEESSVNNINYYTMPVMNKEYPDYYRDIERNAGHMFYTAGGGSSSSGSGSNGNSGGMRMYNS
jgi:hypothetical protein